MSTDDPHLEAMRAALAGLDPEALRAIGAHLPERAAIFDALADALAATPEGAPPDAEALAAAWAGAGDPAALIARLRPALAGAAGQIERVRRGLDTADARLREARALRVRLQGAIAPFVEAAADHDALRDLLQSALDRLTDDAPWAAADRARRAAGALVDDLLGALEQPTPDLDPAVLGARAAELERAEADLRAAPDLVRAAIDLLVDARDLAHDAGHPLRVPLALSVARLADVVRPADAAGAWRITLDRALDAGALEPARAAARRVQADAWARGDHRTSALVSHRIAECARAAGALDVEVIARLEQALALAREPQYAERARAMAADALVGAAHADGETLARARLMQGQLLDHLGDGDAARRVLRQLMQQARDTGDVPPDVLGRAAYTLGASEAAVDHTARARQNLTLALGLAVERDDARLYDAALPALLGLLDRVDPDAARRVFAEADARFEARGQGPELRTALAARFGAAAVGRWMGEAG